MKKLLLLIVFCLFLVACSSQLSGSQPVPETKDLDFNITVLNQEGHQVNLSDFKGKKMYINVWASWCGPCLNEIPEIEEVYQNVKNNQDIVFLSITSPSDKQYHNKRPADKSRQEITDKAKELGITYPILFDIKDQAMSNLSITAFPTHIFLDSNGKAKALIGGVTKEQLSEIIEEME